MKVNPSKGEVILATSPSKRKQSRKMLRYTQKHPEILEQYLKDNPVTFKADEEAIANLSEEEQALVAEEIANFSHES